MFQPFPKTFALPIAQLANTFLGLKPTTFDQTTIHPKLSHTTTLPNDPKIFRATVRANILNQVS